MTEEVPRLPADIMSNIAYRADIPTAIRSRLSRGIEARSREYLKRECERPISTREYISYLEKNPSHVGLFSYLLYEPPSNLILQVTSIIGINVIGYWTGVESRMNMDGADVMYERELSREFDITVEYYSNRVGDFTLDVVTSYYIYKNRLNCMRISSQFAKDLTIKKFLEKVNELESLQDNKNIFVLYLYLYMNAYILNIPATKPSLTQPVLLGDAGQPLPGEMERADIEKLIEQIPILTEKIVKEIEKFD